MDNTENNMNTVDMDNITAKYYPVQPINPEDYSVKQYLYDMNTLLTQIDTDLRTLIEIFMNKEQQQKESKARVIGIH